MNFIFQGFKVTVESSDQRIFKDEEYKRYYLDYIWFNLDQSLLGGGSYLVQNSR